MARRYRLEYLRKKREKELKKQQKLLTNETRTSDGQEEFSLWRELLGWLLYLVVIIGATYLIVTYVGQRTQVSGESMLPALQHEDNLIVDKISYRFRKPERYEIIVFPYKYQENTYYIKRIIGLPGEKVQIKEGEVYIDDKPLGETYGIEPIDEDKKGLAANPIILGPDEYFVLGDNRNHSSDSREPSVGILKREDLIGRAWVRIWPLKSIGVIPHE